MIDHAAGCPGQRPRQLDLYGGIFVLVGILACFTLASINYKLGRIAKSLARLAEIELPTAVAAISEVAEEIDCAGSRVEQSSRLFPAHRGAKLN